MTALMCHDECELCFTCVVFSSRHGCPSWWPAAQGWLLSMKVRKMVACPPEVVIFHESLHTGEIVSLARGVSIAGDLEDQKQEQQK